MKADTFALPYIEMGLRMGILFAIVAWVTAGLILMRFTRPKSWKERTLGELCQIGFVFGALGPLTLIPIFVIKNRARRESRKS